MGRTPTKHPASERVRREWGRRVEAEYGSCAAAHHLNLWLLQVGASPDLIRLGWGIAADELRHAELSHAAYTAAGGSGLTTLPRERLGLHRRADEPLEWDVTRVCVEMFCLGETVAVRLFSAMRAGTTVPVARRALDRVLRDEVRHRDFGWTLLHWLLASPHAPTLRTLIARELPAMAARQREGYAHPGDEPETTLSTGDRAWGLLPGARYVAIVQRAVEGDYLPRFQKLGLDLRAAFG